MRNSWKPNPPCVVSLQVTLEKVLGITSSGNSALACDPRSGLVAYPAGWDERDCLCAVIFLIWPLTYRRSARSQLAYHIYLMRMFSVQISACVCYLCIISEDWSSVFVCFLYPILGEAVSGTAIACCAVLLILAAIAFISIEYKNEDGYAGWFRFAVVILGGLASEWVKAVFKNKQGPARSQQNLCTWADFVLKPSNKAVLILRRPAVKGGNEEN